MQYLVVIIVTWIEFVLFRAFYLKEYQAETLLKNWRWLPENSVKSEVDYFLFSLLLSAVGIATAKAVVWVALGTETQRKVIETITALTCSTLYCLLLFVLVKRFVFDPT